MKNESNTQIGLFHREELVKKAMLFANVIDPRLFRLFQAYNEWFTVLVRQGTEDELADFLEKASDIEVLQLLSKKSLEAPLNDEGYRIYMGLFNRVFAERIEIPDDLRKENLKLDSWTSQILTRYRFDLRAAQYKRIGKAKR